MIQLLLSITSLPNGKDDLQLFVPGKCLGLAWAPHFKAYSPTTGFTNQMRTSIICFNVVLFTSVAALPMQIERPQRAVEAASASHPGPPSWMRAEESLTHAGLPSWGQTEADGHDTSLLSGSLKRDIVADKQDASPPSWKRESVLHDAPPPFWKRDSAADGSLI
ncbi:hypothetical protein D9757_004793 [Collybiopsis confluens]|uniref:Uncharacterized protein n=1 Tax=Collybiopsis confluens TaxID=2823264 RepID=A0A8H5HSE9_9AGAR|nr:hypothetical protein D9757_004793 [Collybiopsis confluens]